jgi:protein involved in polysaccharide export with SLBB domain
MQTKLVAHVGGASLALLMFSACGPHRPAHFEGSNGTSEAAGAVMSTRDRDALQKLTAARAAEKPTDGYRIGPDDLLDVRIPDLTDPQAMVSARLGQTSGTGQQPIGGAPAFQQGLRVSATGEINVQSLGLVKAAGLTPTELEAELARRLLASGILRAPQPSVQVAEHRSGVVAVIGSVERPGLYPVTRPRATLADMLWAAGGPAKDAGRVVEFVAAGGPRGGAPIRVDLEVLLHPEATRSASSAECRGAQCTDLRGNTMSLRFNAEVRPGDTISMGAAGTVTVDGWVEKPGAYPVTRGLTVAGVIAAAGGHLFPADRTKTSIRRVGAAGETRSFDVDLAAVASGSADDVPITDGDVIHVPPDPTRLVPWGVWTVAREMVHVGGSVLLF